MGSYWQYCGYKSVIVIRHITNIDYISVGFIVDMNLRARRAQNNIEFDTIMRAERAQKFGHVTCKFVTKL